jgi:hypothetical protein
VEYKTETTTGAGGGKINSRRGAYAMARKDGMNREAAKTPIAPSKYKTNKNQLIRGVYMILFSAQL